MRKKLIFVIICFFMFNSIVSGAISVFHESRVNNLKIDEFDMVVIAPEVFSSDIQVLINHKNARDVKTFLKTTEEINSEYLGRDLQENIKYFIKDAVEIQSIEYVLIVGSSDLLPSRYVNVYFEYDYQTEWVFYSDLYYADIYDSEGFFCSWDSNENDLFGEYNWQGRYDDLDLYPDVYLGRLACVDNTELDVCINKIIVYETSEAFCQDWFNDIVLIGGDSLLGDEDHVDEGEYVNQNVMDIMNVFTPKLIWASKGLLTHSYNIDNAINEGAGFVFFNGHGHVRTWATHPHESNKWIPNDGYYNSNVLGLVNANKLPIVISDACYHCAYDKASDCFGWTFLTNPYGGAIGFIGGTDVDVSYGGVDIITKGIERLCLIISNNYMQKETLTFGELWGKGLRDYHSDDMDEIDIITLMENQPFGDPSLQIASISNAPDKPQRPSGRSVGKAGVEFMYSTSVTEPDGDEVYLKWDWGDGTFSNWLGPFESDEIVENGHSWNARGDYDIRVCAKDEHGVIGEWSEPLSISMPKVKNYILFTNFFRLIDFTGFFNNYM